MEQKNQPDVMIKNITLQQNDYKSRCTSFVIDQPTFKFFVLIDFTKLSAPSYIDDIVEGINVSFKKIIKNESLSTDTIEQLFESALKDLNKYITELIHLNNLDIKLHNFNCLIGIIFNNNLYFSYTGDIDGFVVYKSKNAQYKIINILSTLEHDEQKNPTSIFSNIITGDIKPHQLLFFATKSIEKYLSLYTIKNILLDKYYIDELSTTLKQTTNNDNFAAIYIRRETVRRTLPTTAKPVNIQVPEKPLEAKKETSTKNSISNLEKTRDMTQELLSPHLIHKAKKWIGGFKKERDNLNTKKSGLADKYTVIILIKQQLENIKRVVLLVIKKSASKQTQSTTKTKPKNGSTSFIDKITQNTFFKDNSNNLTRKKIVPAILLIAVLIFSYNIYSGKKAKNNELLVQQYNSVLANIEDNILKAESSIIHKADERALIHITEANDLMKSLPTISAETVNKEEDIQRITNKISDLQKTLRKEEKVDAEVYAQLPTGNYTGIEATEETVIAFGADKVIQEISIATNNRTEPQIALTENESIIDGTLFERNNTLYLLSNINDLYTANTPLDGYETTRFETDDTKIQAISTFNSNLYSLNPTENQIYKYPKLNAGFGKGRSWITDGSTISTATDLYIDGTIYLLSSDGTIDNYLSGQKTSKTFKPSITPAVTNATSFIYDSDNSRFYIIEPEQSRIIVLSDKGDLIKQITSEQFTDLKDIQLLPGTKDLLILNGSEILKIKK